MQITSRYHYTPIKIVKSKTLTTRNTGQDTEQKEPKFTAGGNTKQYSHSWRQADILCPKDRAIMLLDIYPSKLKMYVHTKTCTHVLRAGLIMTAKPRKW